MLDGKTVILFTGITIFFVLILVLTLLGKFEGE